MPKNMRILEVSSGAFSSTWAASFATDDSDVVVEGATEGTGDSWMEPDEADAMVGQRGGGARCGGRRKLAWRDLLSCRKGVVVLSGRGCWRRRREVGRICVFHAVKEAIRVADSGSQAPHHGIPLGNTATRPQTAAKGRTIYVDGG